MLEFSSVTELIIAINNTLENFLNVFTFEGEISGLQEASGGHLYFSIKDEKSQVSCAMWKSYVYNLKFQPQDGDKVVCVGSANIYNKSGRFQIIVSKMEIKGEGDLKKRYEELKAKLEAEGLFDEERKRPIPFLPKAVGVVTSQTGAVIHDIMFKINERMPQTQVYLIDVRVQGKGAEKEIANAINEFNKLKNVDVLIVGRGGGSLEDLWCFNEEVVARAIFASKIPVVSAVGHESDVSLADLVADKRAPTPTGAAQIVVPDRRELLKQIKFYKEKLSNYQKFLLAYNQSVMILKERLDKALTSETKKYNLIFEKLKSQVENVLNPSSIFNIQKERLKAYKKQLSTNLNTQILFKKKELEKTKRLLSMLDYKKTLKRGFLIARSGEKIICKKQDALKEGQGVLEFADGKINAKFLK